MDPIQQVLAWGDTQTAALVSQGKCCPCHLAQTARTKTPNNVAPPGLESRLQTALISKKWCTVISYAQTDVNLIQGFLALKRGSQILFFSGNKVVLFCKQTHKLLSQLPSLDISCFCSWHCRLSCPFQLRSGWCFSVGKGCLD